MAAKPNPIVIQPVSGWSYNNISYALDDPDTNYDGNSYYQGNLSSPYNDPLNISCGHASHGLSGTDNYYSNYRVIAVKGTTASDSDDWYLWHDGETYSVTGGANIRTNGKTGVTLNFNSSGGKLYFTSNGYDYSEYHRYRACRRHQRHDQHYIGEQIRPQRRK